MSRTSPRARSSDGGTAAHDPCPGRGAANRRRAGRDRTARARRIHARARSGSACSHRASATPTCTSATAIGHGRGRSRWVTRAPASSRRSDTACGRCRSASPWRSRGSCPAACAGRVVPIASWACADSPSFRHRMPDGATVLAAKPTASRSCRTAGSGRWPRRRSCPRRPRSPCRTAWTPAVAALIGCCVTTGVGAVLKTAEVPRGATVAVIGLGGVGLSCVMGAAIAGASRIVAVDRVEAKLDAARAVGATAGLLAGGRPGRDDRVASRPDRRRTRLRLRGDRPRGHRRARDREPADRRNRRPRRADAVRGSRLVRGVPARRRQPADPRLELRLRRAGDRLPALRRDAPRRPAAGRAAHRPRGSGSTTSRTPSTGSGRATASRQVVGLRRGLPAGARARSGASLGLHRREGGRLGLLDRREERCPVISRVPRPWVRKLQAQRTSTTSRFAKPMR